MRRRTAGRVALCAALAGGGLAVLPMATAQAAVTAAAGKGVLPAGKSWTVTLVTGDVVKVSTVKGRLPTVSAKPGKGRANKLFHTSYRPNGHVVVTPVDVASQVGKVLDPRLFDVTTLIRQGYDDARSKELPLIVAGNAGVRTLGARRERELSSIGAVAVRQPKGQGVRLGPALTSRSSGIRHIWLDQKVKTSSSPAVSRAVSPTIRAAKLDRNLTQVGAPAAWKAGFTGRGIAVAVLDTGVDATHPDLAGRIAETKNFSTAEDVADRDGHGTHVAATVAGTGKAAGGERTGVAPDASLLIGKVLNDEGEGELSDVIAGAEWAAPRAKVVNMSLGGFEPSDGTDPVSQAVDKLTAEHGSLFVVAAGNTGGLADISTPAAAGSALTVGAVDGEDALAEFSSRGPRPGRYAAKPEIVAPGVDIVAARAAGTTMGEPVDERYIAASGTSMATPHVAGAAALVAQRHPDWKAGQIKAALTGAADPAKGGDAFERGTGRLDAGTAVTAPAVSSTGVVHLGTAAYPQTGTLTSKVSWTGREAASLPLSVRLVRRNDGVVKGAATLSETKVDVPAKGTATATLQIDVAKLKDKPGLYAAEVDAKGGPHTLVTFYVEPPSHTLTVKATALPDTPEGAFSAYTGVLNVEDVAQYVSVTETDADGTAKLRVPSGRYSVMGAVFDSTDGKQRAALVGDPEVMVDRDVTVTLDGAGSKEVKATVPGKATETTMAAAHYVRGNGQGLWGDSVYSLSSAEKVYAQPTEAVTKGTFKAYSAFRLTAPGTVWDLLEPMGDRIPADPTFVVTPAVQARLARVDQRFATLDGGTTRPDWQKRYGMTPEGVLLQEGEGDVPTGTTRTDYVSAGRGLLWNDEASPGLLDGWVDQEPFSPLKPGSRVTKTWGRQPMRPGPNSATTVRVSGCEPPASVRSRGVMTVVLVDLQTRPDGFDCDLPQEPDPTKRKMTLYAGDSKIREVEARGARFTVPTAPATYRLRYENDSSAALPVSTRTSTDWTFRSKAPAGTGTERLPLLTVDYDLGLDLRNQPVGKPAVFTVARVKGSGTAKITGLKFWTSIDDGKTWTPVGVKALGGGRFSAPLPAPVKGQSVSLRVAAGDAGGSTIDQQIIRTYNVR
ncbi:S8 family serine peptidase [Actinomadura rudentiformis]|uniref:S8 family serine peptidase n=1 Tax=Actinomadura rudentiformis TaxID=359158 RepID=A0A6H9Z1S0_9ACTN|nr:S8 family serine peptidase [Actinomadura rudentiformis]KAB2348498.1 S8 family serine peptidase [Actinomadura rudentiformis]